MFGSDVGNNGLHCTSRPSWSSGVNQNKKTRKKKKAFVVLYIYRHVAPSAGSRKTGESSREVLSSTALKKLVLHRGSDSRLLMLGILWYINSFSVPAFRGQPRKLLAVVYSHTPTQLTIHVHTETHMHSCTYIHTYTHMLCTYTDPCTHTYTYTHTHRCIQKGVNTYMLIYNICKYLYIHTCIHTALWDTHTHRALWLNSITAHEHTWTVII